MLSQPLPSFERLIKENELVFVYFWAEWCSPCKQFAAIYEQVAEEFPGIIFAKVNIEEQQELSKEFGIRSIPHLLVFKQGMVIYTDAGNIPASVLRELVLQAWNMDMDLLLGESEERL